MNKHVSTGLLALVGVLAACCVIVAFGTLVLFAAVAVSQPEFSVADAPARTWTPAPTWTPFPRTTGGNQGASGSAQQAVTPTPVLARTLGYNLFVPTPSAPSLKFPITYDTGLDVETYTVSGLTLKAISAGLDANALVDPHENNSRYYARTDWHLGGQWDWKSTPRGCEVDHGEVSIQITLTLPSLVDQPGLPTDVRSRWGRFIENTITHESGHAKIAMEGARDYQRELGNFPVAADCNSLKSRLKDLFDRSFAAIDQANVRYDSETRHGLSQGAVFP